MIIDPSMFEECSKCECALEGIQKERGKIEEFCNILSCGHVVCDSCIDSLPTSHVTRNCCPICLNVEPRITVPSTRGELVYCASHLNQEAKFYCEECMRFYCSEEDCKKHSIIRIEEISLKTSKLNREIASSESYIQHLCKMEETTYNCLGHLGDKSWKLEDTFNSIINVAVKRYSEILSRIQAEKAKVERISKDIEGVKRRIRVAYNIHQISSTIPEKVVSDAYTLAAGNILKKGIDIYEILETTSENMQCYKLDFEGENCVENVTKDLRTLFPKYTVSIKNNCASHEIPSQINVEQREEKYSYLKEILFSGVGMTSLDMSEIYKSQVRAVVRKTISNQESFTLLTPESQSSILKIIEESFDEDSQTLIIQALVNRIYYEQNVEKLRNSVVNEKMIKIEPPVIIQSEYEKLFNRIPQTIKGLCQEEQSGRIERTDIKIEIEDDETPTKSNGEYCESHEGTCETSNNTESQMTPPRCEKTPNDIPGKYKTQPQDSATKQNIGIESPEIMNCEIEKFPPHRRKASSVIPERSGLKRQNVTTTMCETREKRRKTSMAHVGKEVQDVAKNQEIIKNVPPVVQGKLINNVHNMVSDTIEELCEQEQSSRIDAESGIEKETENVATPTTSTEEYCEYHEEICESSKNSNSQLVPPHCEKTPSGIESAKIMDQDIKKVIQVVGVSKHRRKAPNSIPQDYQTQLMTAFRKTTSKQKPFTLLTPESQNIVLQRVDELCEEERNRRKGTKIEYLEEKVVLEQHREVIRILVDELYNKEKIDDVVNQVVKQQSIEINPRGKQKRIRKQKVLKIGQPGIMDKEIKEVIPDVGVPSHNTNVLSIPHRRRKAPNNIPESQAQQKNSMARVDKELSASETPNSIPEEEYQSQLMAAFRRTILNQESFNSLTPESQYIVLKKVDELCEEEKNRRKGTNIDFLKEEVIIEQQRRAIQVLVDDLHIVPSHNTTSRPQFYGTYPKRGASEVPGQYLALGERKIVVDKNYTANYASVQSAFQNTTLEKEPFSLLTPESRCIVLQKVDEFIEEEQNRRKGTKIDYLKEKVIIEQQRKAIQALVDELYDKQQMDELLKIGQKILRSDQPGIMDKEFKEVIQDVGVPSHVSHSASRRRKAPVDIPEEFYQKQRSDEHQESVMKKNMIEVGPAETMDNEIKKVYNTVARKVEELSKEKKIDRNNIESDIEKQTKIVETPTKSKEKICESHEEICETSDNSKSPLMPPRCETGGTQIVEKKHYTAKYASVQSAFRNTTFKQESFNSLTQESRDIVVERVNELYEEEKNRKNGTRIDCFEEEAFIEQQRQAIQDFVDELYDKQKMDELQNQVVRQKNVEIDPREMQQRPIQQEFLSETMHQKIRKPIPTHRINALSEIPEQCKSLITGMEKPTVNDYTHSMAAYRDTIYEQKTFVLLNQTAKNLVFQKVNEFCKEEKVRLEDSKIDYRNEKMIVESQRNLIQTLVKELYEKQKNEELRMKNNHLNLESTEVVDNESEKLIPPHRRKALRVTTKATTGEYINLMTAIQNTIYEQEPFILLIREAQDIVIQKVKQLCDEEKIRRAGSKIDYEKEEMIVESQRNLIQTLVEELYEKQKSEKPRYRKIKKDILNHKSTEIVNNGSVKLISIESPIEVSEKNTSLGAEEKSITAATPSTSNSKKNSITRNAEARYTVPRTVEASNKEDSGSHEEIGETSVPVIPPHRNRPPIYVSKTHVYIGTDTKPQSSSLPSEEAG